MSAAGTPDHLAAIVPALPSSSAARRLRAAAPRSALDSLCDWADTMSPGEVELRVKWLATVEVPSTRELEAALQALPVGNREFDEHAAVAVDAALEAMTNVLLAERQDDGRFRFTDRWVYLNLLAAITEGLDPDGIEEGFLDWRATW